MDKRVAKIISDDEEISIIESNVEEYHPKGGSGSKMKGGPQDVVQDGKYLVREKHQMKDFFRDVAKNLSNVDKVVVFGPSESGRRFAHELKEHHTDLRKKLLGVEKADTMTDNQLKAWVKEFFK